MPPAQSAACPRSERMEERRRRQGMTREAMRMKGRLAPQERHRSVTPVWCPASERTCGRISGRLRLAGGWAEGWAGGQEGRRMDGLTGGRE